MLFLLQRFISLIDVLPISLGRAGTLGAVLNVFYAVFSMHRIESLQLSAQFSPPIFHLLIWE